MASIVEQAPDGKTDAHARVENELEALERHRSEIQDHAIQSGHAGGMFCGGRALGLGEAIDCIRAALRGDA